MKALAITVAGNEVPPLQKFFAELFSKKATTPRPQATPSIKIPLRQGKRKALSIASKEKLPDTVLGREKVVLGGTLGYGMGKAQTVRKQCDIAACFGTVFFVTCEGEIAAGKLDTDLMGTPCMKADIYKSERPPLLFDGSEYPIGQLSVLDIAAHTVDDVGLILEAIMKLSL